MVKFSCFSTPPVNRSTNVDQRYIATLQADHQSVTQDQSIMPVKGSVISNSMPDNYSYVKRSTSPYSMRDCWRSDGLNKEVLQIKKSGSLRSIMEKKSGYSGDDITEDDDIDHEFPFDLLNAWNLKENPESSDKNNANSTENFHHENDRKNYQNLKKNDLIKPADVLKDPMHHESLFSIEALKQHDRDWRVDIAVQVVDDVVDSKCPSRHIPTLSKSYSAINLRVNTTGSGKNGSSHGHIFRRSHSFSDLQNLNVLETELQNGEKYFDKEEGGVSLVRRKIINFSASEDASRKSEANDDKITRECQHKSSYDDWDQLSPQEFSIRRVENWISQIDIHGDLIVEEQGESSTTTSKEDSQILAGADLPKPDARSNLAMEVAYNYISSLTSSSSSAQMANIGLVAIPVLTQFVSLRVLNLSGNALVHITPGCLPKGLHMLNLSKNNIATIEGLRDLSRLRVLDLNNNRIARIGHGLASCSSLKELYLAGNKISEVEGLHRLLKLNTLDLRFNKISTSKGLGQLAVNYVSLQAINLEGNPAQKNVGDEQLKKFLFSLLPNLVYYNKQAIQMGSKDGSNSGMDQLASSHGQQVQVPAIEPQRKPSSNKDRRVRLQLPPDTFKPTNQRSDAGKKQLDLNTNDAAMKRSRSTDALRVFSNCNYMRK